MKTFQLTVVHLLDLYHELGSNKTKLATTLNVSRTTVSSMLKECLLGKDILVQVIPGKPNQYQLFHGVVKYNHSQDKAGKPQLELMQSLLNQTNSIDETARLLADGHNKYNSEEHYRKRLIHLVTEGDLII